MVTKLNPDTGLFEVVEPAVVEDALKDTVPSTDESTALKTEVKEFLQSSNLRPVDSSDELVELEKKELVDVAEVIANWRHQKKMELQLLLKHAGMDTQQQNKLFTEIVELFSL